MFPKTALPNSPFMAFETDIGRTCSTSPPAYRYPNKFPYYSVHYYYWSTKTCFCTSFVGDTIPDTEDIEQILRENFFNRTTTTRKVLFFVPVN